MNGRVAAGAGRQRKKKGPKYHRASIKMAAESNERRAAYVNKTPDGLVAPLIGTGSSLTRMNQSPRAGP